MVPWCLGSNEEMHLDLDARIAIDAAERHSMHRVAGDTTQCGSTGLAEAQTPTWHRLIKGEIVFAAEPGERTWRNFSVSRARSAKGFSAARAMATAPWPERRGDLVPDRSATAAACQSHDRSRSVPARMRAASESFPDTSQAWPNSSMPLRERRAESDARHARDREHPPITTERMNNGAGCGTRTRDLPLTRRLLYQLS
ncbi:MAG: hypothetical protein K0S56_2288 [Microvirga sp.]|nr:hypothetical protein [Microvirga sp.]